MKPPLDTIICGDNVTVMSEWDDECVDMIITSCPYDDQREYNGYSWSLERLAEQMYRVMKPGAVAPWVVGAATKDFGESLTPFKHAIHFVEAVGFNLLDTMIYHRSFPTWNEDRRAYRQNFEYIFVLSKGRPKTFNPIKDVKTRWHEPRNVTLRKPNNDLKREYYTPNKKTARGNIWFYETGYMKSTTDKEAYEHPAIFPDKLACDLIISWSNPGDIVLDPFIGSGTVGKMSVLSGRHFIGIDISPEYCQLAERRIAAVKQQPKLFSWDLQPAV